MMSYGQILTTIRDDGYTFARLAGLDPSSDNAVRLRSLPGAAEPPPKVPRPALAGGAIAPGAAGVGAGSACGGGRRRPAE